MSETETIHRISSCPGLSRALQRKKKDVDDRNKPGHDEKIL
jgi:hypothetical protein